MNILLGLLMIIPCFAGIRVVGKGGGYAEMQALYVNLKMESWLQACFKSPGSCQLTRTDADLVERVAKINFNLGFDPTCEISKVKIESASAARISSCQLYLEEASKIPLAKPFREIAKIVLTTRLIASGNLSENLAKNLADRLFDEIEQEEDSLILSSESGSFLAHALSVQLLEKKFSIISIEGRKATFEIDLAQIKELRCDGGLPSVQIRWIGAQDLGQNRGLFEAEANWSCRGERPRRGTLQIFFGSHNSEVSPEQTQVRLVKIQSI